MQSETWRGVMKFYRNNWYYIGGIYFVILSFILGLWGYNHVSHIQLILIYSFMALLVHQFEEYALPGGFPAIMNSVLSREKEQPDRYPLNKNSCFIVNVVLGYTFYLSAVIFPDAIWLGLTQVLFGMLQFLIHGIVINVRMKTFYNPGLAAVIFLHFPVGIYYIWYVVSNGLITTADYIWGFIAVIIAAILIVALPVRVLANRNTKYPFTEDEMERFHVREKLGRV
jgi:hypothetical protein